MRIGIDLDNTIVSYDGLFHRIAVRNGVIGPEVLPTKHAVREFLRSGGREDVWTELQGRVYGESMGEAQPFPGVAEFLAAAASQGYEVFVISHRTRFPYLGPRYDLHQAAQEWLRSHDITGSMVGRIPDSHVFLEESLDAKLQRIGEQQCDTFVDDLPELLLHPAFPASVKRICFDPVEQYAGTELVRVSSWQELARICFRGASP
jgi:hypothetical protein